MKGLVFVFILIPILSMAQFGFERKDDIIVIKNNLQQKFPWVGGLDNPQYSNIDLNLDGVQDLFIFDRSTYKILAFIQNGQTGEMNYEYAPEYEKKFPDVYKIGWVLLVDYNGDGRKDMFISAPGGAKVYKNISTQVNGLSFELASLFYQQNLQ